MSASYVLEEEDLIYVSQLCVRGNKPTLGEEFHWSFQTPTFFFALLVY